MSKFEYLTKQYDPRGRTASFTLPIRGAIDPETGKEMTPRLFLQYAGEANRPFHNALMKFNAKTGLSKKAVQGRSDVGDLALERDLDLYPKFVITGWEGIPDDQLRPVPFSSQDCADFVAALPKWLFDEVRMYAMNAVNFLPEDEPSPDDVKETVGN